MLFKDLPEQKKKTVINNFNSIQGILNESDSEQSILYINWMLKQLVDSSNNLKEIKYNDEIRKLKKQGQQKHYYEIDQLIKKRKKVRASNYAYDRNKNFVKGDVVHVSFGIGYCDEISDGHYGIILSDILGTMYLIAPLSSREPRGILQDKHAIKSFTGLNLPSKENKDTSYVEYNQIRFVHFRRLEYFGNKQREHVSDDDVKEILDTLYRII